MAIGTLNGLAFVDGVRASCVTSGTPGVTTQDFVVTSGQPRTPKAARIIVTSATAANTTTDHLQRSEGVPRSPGW